MGTKDSQQRGKKYLDGGFIQKESLPKKLSGPFKISKERKKCF